MADTTALDVVTAAVIVVIDVLFGFFKSTTTFCSGCPLFFFKTEGEV